MSLLYINIIALLVMALMLMRVHVHKIQRKHQQEQLQQEQQQSLHHLQSLINNIPDLTWVKDKDSRYLLTNKAFSSFFGFSQKDIIGKTDIDICADKEQAKAFLDDDIKIKKEKKVVLLEEK